jgi:hypothetical protein
MTRVVTASMLHVGDLLFEHGRPSGRVIEIEPAEDRTLHVRVGAHVVVLTRHEAVEVEFNWHPYKASWYCAAEGCLQQPALDSTLCYYHQKDDHTPAIGREPSVFDEVTRETQG